MCLSYVPMCFIGSLALNAYLIDDMQFEDDRECEGCEWPNQGRDCSYGVKAKMETEFTVFTFCVI